MKDGPKEIHVWNEGKYVGNIIYTHRVPPMSEEELEEIRIRLLDSAIITHLREQTKLI